MTDPLSWIDEEAAAWRERGLERRLIPTARHADGLILRDGRELVNFGSNDYLGLANDPRIIAAAHAASQNAWGAGASPLVSGWTDAHETLARELAAFEDTEAAVLFPTGYAANVGTITALVGKLDVIYADALNHACLIDGARLSGATVRVYPHTDVTTLAQFLKEDAGEYRRGLVVTDGVFSMDGDMAPLDQIVPLVEHFGRMLLVDEAHGTGVRGAKGRGAAEWHGVADRVTVKVGTLSKALGSVGGFVAGSRLLIDWLINHARPLIFSTASPAATAAAASAALRIVIAEPERRTHLLDLASRLRDGLRASGEAIAEGFGPIVPVVLGHPAEAVTLASKLADAGFYVPAIRPPSVPEGTSRLRICLNSGLDATTIDRFILAFAAARA